MTDLWEDLQNKRQVFLGHHEAIANLLLVNPEVIILF